MTRKAGRRAGLLAVLTALALVLTSAPAFAAGGPPAGSGHGTGAGSGGGGGGAGRGGGGETTVTNNLSVPAIFVGGTNPFGLTSTAASDPTGTPLSGYPLDSQAYYYVQGVNKWQASWGTTAPTSATADFGDNLAGDASLVVGHPIRIEVGMLAASPTDLNMTGFTVEKLDPNALDRESAYGTLAAGSTAGSAAVNKVLAYPEVRVWDGQAKLTITDSNGVEVSGVTTSAEINATGRVVYGYNLTVQAAGTYTLKFYAPNVNLTAAEGGQTPTLVDSHTVTTTFIVSTNSGGGSGGTGEG